MIINPYIFSAAAGGGYLVDDYSPTNAWGLRKLNSSATNCIRVRRSSDSTEQDIGFSGDDLDTASMETFCGAGDGFVVTWYDQQSGGSSIDLTMSTAANQPKIVSTGTTLTDPNNSNPAMQADGTNDYFSVSPALNTGGNLTFIGVYNRASTGINSQTFGQTGATYRVMDWRTSNSEYFRIVSSPGAKVVDSSNTSTGDFLEYVDWDGTNASLWKNNSSIGSTGYVTATSGTCDAMLRSSTLYHNGYTQEILYWTSDQTSNRTDIQTNINDYYSIY